MNALSQVGHFVPPSPQTRLNRINIACMEIDQLKSLWNHVSAIIFRQTCDDIDQKMKIHYKRTDIQCMVYEIASLPNISNTGDF